MATPVANIDEYIASFPTEVQLILSRIRALIRDAAPGATESIRYGMPSARLGDGYHLYFAAWKRHVGLYPVATLDDHLERELTGHRSGKDTVRFSQGEPLPDELIGRLVEAIVKRHSGGAS